MHSVLLLFFFFFNDTATTEIYTLSLHDALPISELRRGERFHRKNEGLDTFSTRSEEHTSELQSHLNLVCRLLLEKINSTSPLTISQQKQLSILSHINAELVF